MISESLRDIIPSPFRFNEGCLPIIQETHPRLENVLFIGVGWRSGLINRIDWSPSFTVEKPHINPFQSSLMDVDQGIMVTADDDQASSSKPSIIFKNAKIFIK